MLEGGWESCWRRSTSVFIGSLSLYRICLFCAYLRPFSIIVVVVIAWILDVTVRYMNVYNVTPITRRTLVCTGAGLNESSLK